MQLAEGLMRDAAAGGGGAAGLDDEDPDMDGWSDMDDDGDDNEPGPRGGSFRAGSIPILGVVRAAIVMMPATHPPC